MTACAASPEAAFRLGEREVRVVVANAKTDSNMAALLGTVGLDRESCSLQSHADTQVQPSIHPGVAPTFEHRSFCPCAAAS